MTYSVRLAQHLDREMNLNFEFQRSMKKFYNKNNIRVFLNIVLFLRFFE